MPTFSSNDSTLFENRKPLLSSFFKRSGMWTVAKIAQATIILLIFYGYALELGKEEYGNYQKAFVLIGFLSGLLCFGLPSFISSLPQQGLEKALIHIYSKSKWIVISIGFAFLIVTYMLFPEFSSIEKACLLALSMLSAVNLILEIYALKKSKDSFILFQNLLYSGCYLLIHFIVLFVNYQLSFLLFLLLLLSLVRAVWISYKLKLNSSSNYSDEALSTVSLFPQWGYLAFHETVDAFSKYIDKIVLIGLITATDFAIYYNGSFEIPFVGLLVAAVGTFLNLQITQYQLQNTAILQLFRTSTLWCAALLFPLFFYAWLYAPSLFSVLFKNKYNDAVSFFLIYAWIIPLRIANYTAVLQTKMRNNIIMAGSISALLLKLLLMLLCYPLLGVKGIALAMVAGTYYQVMFYIFYTRKELHVSLGQVLPFKKLSIVFIISGIITFCFYSLLVNEKTIYQVVGGGVITLITSFLIFRFYIQNHLKQPR